MRSYEVSLALLLPFLATASISAKFAGNEDYALSSRQLKTPAVKARSATVNYQSTAVSFTVGEGDDAKQYLSPIGSNFKTHTLSPDWGLDGYKGQNMAVTVFNVEGEVTCDQLGQQVSAYKADDDVWDEAFLQAVILQSNTSYHVTSGVADCIKGWGGNLIVKKDNATSSVSDIGLAHVSSGTIPAGPYYARIEDDILLTEMYRVYRDENQAFTSAVIPTTDGKFTDLSTTAPGMNTLSIPVPSRLYTMNMASPRPLEGRRVAVKDIFDIAGLKTGCGNRAYFNTYPPREASAYAVQKLVDNGAILVGKAKTSSFANGESATSDWVDQMCPYNPRADGYQQPSSSSSGPGAAIASYEWLDNTIGSDTGCSILCPSSSQGVFGLRPSWGKMSLEGVMPMAPPMDTAGFFSRDAVKGRDFSKGWYGDLFQSYTELPKTLIFPTPDWTFPASSPAKPLFDAFREAVTDFIKPTTIDNRTFEGFWNSTGMYEQTGNQSTAAFLRNTWGTLVDYWQWNNFAVPWFEDYGASNDGRIPFVAPSPNIRWAWGRVNLTQANYDEEVRRKAVYQSFVIDNVLTPDNTTCSKTIYFSPYNTGTSPAYRNIYRSPPSNGFFNTGMESFMAGNPQMMIPIGQLPYQSTVSNHTEYLPASVTAYAAPGCDYVLWDLAAALQEAGILSSVATGRTAFPQ
ncbi:hypothetical protein IAR55_006709 [Kwoniella newhampshirensis]|uniref:Amidase domain-containing protein n=1 Tax=Kwoniella newhampshirensis TaxID=1651941 RepID=A0AAW0YSI0_9TREE